LGSRQKNGGKKSGEKAFQAAHPHPRARRTTNKPGRRKSGVARIVAGERLNPSFAPPKQCDLAQTEQAADPEVTKLRAF
jgi:hypothetical protein